MTFSSPFSRPVSPAFWNAGAASAWWLSGGIAASNAIAAYQPKGAASLAASYVNLANPGTYDAAPGTAPTIDATGWKFTAASATYLRTGITPSSLNWSAIVRFSSAPVGDQWLFGYYTAQGFGAIPNKTAGGSHEYYYGNVKNISGGNAAGVMGFAKNQGYINGSADGTTWTQSAHTAAEIFIGDINLTGQHRYYGGYIQAIAFYDTTLNGAQMAALTIAMNAL